MSYLKLTTSSFSLLALAAAIAPAAAADLPVKAPPVVVAAVYDWTGFYIGVHGGGGFGKKDADTPAFTITGLPILASTSTTKPSGFLGGGQIGYNFYQSPTPWWFGGRVVLGIEAQGSWANMDDTVACTSTAATVPPLTLSANCTSKVDALGTAALRYGTAWDRFLFYSKIGVAWARDKYSVVSTTIGLPSDFSAHETRWGWMSGTGVELAMGNNWSVKAEYNYMSMGREQVTFSGTPVGTTFDADIKQRIHVVKFGINYRFGSQAVVARY